MSTIWRLLLLCAWATPCLAKEATSTPRLANHWEIGPVADAEQFPVALGGYCVVALRDHGEWKLGRGGEVERFDGLEYRFDSARDRHIFMAAREAFVPMLGGDCPITYAETGARVAGKLEHGILHKKRLVFFAGPDRQRQFEANPEKYENVDLALDGRSVVSMIDDRLCVAGIPGTAVIHRGMRYFFANDFQRRTFLANPGRYDGTGEKVERPNLLMESDSFSEQLSVESFSGSRQGFGMRYKASERQTKLSVLPSMSGYCPVTLRENGTWVRGRQEFSVELKEFLFFAAGAREQELLQDDPAEYLPAMQGECVVSFVHRGEHVRGSVFHAAEYDGRLFLLADAKRKAEFKANPAKYATVDLAAKGNCAVTLVDQQREVLGLQQFSVWHEGKIYRFAGAAEKAKFLAHIERYAEDAE